MIRSLFGGIPAEAINHGFSQKRPIRSVQIPPESGICPTDFTDIHRFFHRSFLSRRFRRWRRFFYSSDDTEFIRRYSCGGDYSRIFTEATCPVGADTHWGWNMSHRFHRYTQIFIHRMTRNLFGGFRRRRLLTDFRGGDLSGRCRYPLRVDKEIQQRFHKKSVYICEICGTK